MKKIISLLISVFLFPLVFGALPEGTYGSGLYGSGLYGVQSSAKATFTSDVAIQPNSSVNIEANQSNTTLEIITDSSYSGFVTIVRYDSTPSGTGSSPASALNKYVSISTGDIDLNYSVINVKYSDIEISSTNLQENSIRLYKWNGSQWIKFDGAGIGGVDTSNNFVFANTTSFSTWGVFGSTNPSPSPAPSGGGGGGGGGFYSPKDSNQSITYRLNLIKDQKYDFSFNGDNHKISIISIDIIGKTAIFSFESEKMNIELKIKEPVLFNYNNDNYNDLEITLNEIYGKDVVDVTIKTIHLLIKRITITSPEIGEFIESIGGLNIIEEPTTIEIQEETTAPQQPVIKGNGKLLAISFISILIIIAGYIYYNYKSKKKDKEDAKQQKGNQREDKH